MTQRRVVYGLGRMVFDVIPGTQLSLKGPSIGKSNANHCKQDASEVYFTNL